MSRIEDALKKLRQPSTPVAPPAKTTQRSSIPLASKKKVAVEGDKHHVVQADLVAGGLLAPLDHATAVADDFRRIKRPLIVNATKADAELADAMNVIMIASALPGAGKTFCSVNLAVSISLERELNVLLVDADVPKPHISREFGLSDKPGLIDLLLDEQSDVADFLVRTDLNDITVLPAGRAHPQATELLASDRMSQIVRELASRYRDRIVLLDSPPLLLTSEAQALASQVGQIALVVEAGETSHQMLAHALEVLDHDKAVNLILNKTRGVMGGGYYGGDYGYYADDARA
ncbi:MAG TPA: XrtA-associated tyrosine autokinase [Gammaproteobacteria bacterium]|nr:XrtA-associated tyrosine autokinase [Gammaproteobacteria bacterium]